MDNNYYGNICYCRRCNGVVHTIKKGDTLYLISKYYKVPIGEIMNANRNLNIYNLQIGDEICIPVRRPEPAEGGNTTGAAVNQRNLQMPLMPEPEVYVPNNVNPVRETDNEINQDANMSTAGSINLNLDGNTNSDRNTVMESVSDTNDIRTMSAQQDISDNIKDKLKLSEVLSKNDMTFEEFVMLVREFGK